MAAGFPSCELKVDVAHPAVKREFRSVAERLSLLRTVIRKMDHVSGAFLEARRVLSQHKDRPFRAVPDQTDSLPHINCFAETVAPFGYEDHAGARRFLHAVDGLLQCAGVVADAVGVYGELVFRQIDGPRVFRSDRVAGIRMKRNGRSDRQDYCGDEATSCEAHRDPPFS